MTYTDDESSSNWSYADHLAHGDFTEGATYKIEFDVIGTHRVLLYIKGGIAINTDLAPGHYVYYTVAGDSTASGIRLAANLVVANGSIDNLSVKKLNGNPGLTAADATFVKLPV